MPKILLINPPCIELCPGARVFTSKHPPLGLAYLASFLEKNNIEVGIYDSFAEDASMKDAEKKIIATDAEIIGLTSVTATIREAIQIATIAKKHNKKTIIGGAHVTALPGWALNKYYCFDYEVIGEGEITLYELINEKKLEEIDGLVYRKGNEVVVNKRRNLIEDLSVIPFPRRSLLKNYLYKPSLKEFPRSKIFFTMITSRGCPFQCIFCASKTIWGLGVRTRPLADVIAEIEELKRMGMEQLFIVDDMFTVNADRVEQICKKIKSFDIQWGCKARVDCVTPEMLKLLRYSNCAFIEYGIESGSQKILDIMKKGITLEQIKETLKLTKEAGIRTNCSFIIGNIGETEATFKETIRLAKELNPRHAQFGILAPYPGTEAYEIAKKEGYLIKGFEDYTNPKYSDPAISLPGISPKRIKKLVVRAYISFYLSPQRIFRFINDSLTSFYELKRNSRSLFELMMFYASMLDIVQNCKKILAKHKELKKIVFKAQKIYVTH
jgi:radical SAM superfamily enzyme YgiQ (UPF0313 family)